MKKVCVAVLVLILLLGVTGCSSSSPSYNGGYEQWKKDNNYNQKNESNDRKFSNDEIQNFVNNYGGKW